MQHLARLKHPSVLRLVAPLEETRTQLVFLSEPVFASLGDLLQADQWRLPPQLGQVGAEGCVWGGGDCSWRALWGVGCAVVAAGGLDAAAGALRRLLQLLWATLWLG